MDRTDKIFREIYLEHELLSSDIPKSTIKLKKYRDNREEPPPPVTKDDLERMQNTMAAQVMSMKLKYKEKDVKAWKIINIFSLSIGFMMGALII